MKRKYIISIDPDLKKNGYSLFDYDDLNLIECKSVFIWDLFKLIENYNNIYDLYVFLEFSKNNTVWHKFSSVTAQNVGKNKAISIILKDFLILNNIKHKTFELNGYSAFFKDVNFFKQITKFEKTTNIDARASASIIYKNINKLSLILKTI